jgi:hypothetical protein
MRHASNYGLSDTAATFSFKAVMQRIHDRDPRHRAARQRRALHRPGCRGAAGLREAGQPLDGRNRAQRRWHAALTTRSIVIATGARPFVPPLPGLEDVGYVTSDTLWDDLRQARRGAPASGGARRRPDRVRAGPELRPPGLAGDAGRDGQRIMIREDEEVSALAESLAGSTTAWRAHRSQGTALRTRWSPRRRWWSNTPA